MKPTNEMSATADLRFDVRCAMFDADATPCRGFISFSLGLRMKLLLAALALVSAGSVAADCPKAADWARAFYSEHYSFYAGAPDPILQFTTPEFGALLKKEWAYSKGEVGHMDYDPWLGAQDGEIRKPVRFVVESESPEVAVVSMTYPFVLDPKHPPERHTVHLVLR